MRFGELDTATRAAELASSALTGAEVAVAADRHRLSLTRFANSVIHQNVAEDTTAVRIRVHHEGRTASGSSTIIDDGGLQALVARTIAAVRVAPRDPGWPGLAPATPSGTTPTLDEATAMASPADRAAVVRAFVDAAGGLETAGFCRTNHWSGAFVNSAGQSVAGEGAECGFSGIARVDGADGVARFAPTRLTDIDGAVLGARAAAKARAGVDPIEIPPDRYEVVLEPTAVSDILESLASFGFNAKTVGERRSFVRLGDAQFDPSVTIVDDPLVVGVGYDAEGSPRQRLVLVEGGTTVALTHDRRTAAEVAGADAESDVRSTGHGDGGGPWGPSARHLTMLASTGSTASSGELAGVREVDGPVVDSSVAGLVAAVERGVLVTDFWYTRVLDPRTLAITGLTRNGIWLIEHGEVTRPLRNFRFTQAYAQALMPDNVRAVGLAATPMPGDTYAATSPRWTAPGLHLASWNFTGGASG